MLTEQGKRFAESYARQGFSDRVLAAVRAGFKRERAERQSLKMLKNSDVAAYIDELKAAMLDEVRGRITSAAADAIEVEYNIMLDEDAKHSDRLSAARDILDRAGTKATATREKATSAVPEVEKESGMTGVIALSSVDLEAYEKEKKKVLDEAMKKINN